MKKMLKSKMLIVCAAGIALAVLFGLAYAAGVGVGGGISGPISGVFDADLDGTYSASEFASQFGEECPPGCLKNTLIGSNGTLYQCVCSGGGSTGGGNTGGGNTGGGNTGGGNTGGGNTGGDITYFETNNCAPLSSGDTTYSPCGSDNCGTETRQCLPSPYVALSSTVYTRTYSWVSMGGCQYLTQ